MKRSFQNLLCFIDIIILPLLILKSGFSLFTYSNVSIIFILIFIALLIYLIKNNEVNLIVSYVVISAIGIIPLIQFHGADIYTYSEMKVNYLYMLSIIIGILLVTRLKHVKYKMFIFDYILCLYWLLTLISTFLSVDVNISIFGTAGRYEGLVTISCYILLYFLASKFLTSYTTLNFKFIIISATIIGIYAIMQYYGIDPFHQIYKYLLGNEAYSTIGNRDFVGSYITLLLPILIYTFISTKKYIYILSSGILFTSMLCINARSAWVAFIVYIFILSIFIFMKKYKRRNFILLIALFTIIFIVFNFRQNNMLSSRIVSINSDAKTLVQNKSPESIDNGRYFIWERAIKIIPKFPLLGSGPDTFSIVFRKTYTSDILNTSGIVVVFDKAHNEYLQIAVTEGIPALLLYLVFLTLVAIKVFKGIKYNKLLIPLFCSIGGYLVQAFFNISVVAVAPVLWCFIGIAVNLADKTEGEILSGGKLER